MADLLKWLGPRGRKNCNPLAAKPVLLPKVFRFSRNWLYSTDGWSDVTYSRFV